MMKTKTKLKLKNNWKTKTKTTKINQNENHTDWHWTQKQTKKPGKMQIVWDSHKLAKRLRFVSERIGCRLTVQNISF